MPAHPTRRGGRGRGRGGGRGRGSRKQNKPDRVPSYSNHGIQVGKHYLDNKYLLAAPNVPARLYDALIGKGDEADESNNKQWDDLKRISAKYDEVKRKRKKLRAPSVKEVRKNLHYMVNFSASRHEKELASAYPLLKREGEEDSDDEDLEEDDSKPKGVIDLRGKNVKKLGEALQAHNPNIPLHRR